MCARWCWTTCLILGMCPVSDGWRRDRLDASFLQVWPFWSVEQMRADILEIVGAISGRMLMDLGTWFQDGRLEMIRRGPKWASMEIAFEDGDQDAV